MSSDPSAMPEKRRSAWRRTARTALRMVDRLMAPVTVGAAFIGMVALLAIMCLTLANVILRAVANGSVADAVEGSQALLILSVFLGFGIAQRRNTHVATGLLTLRAPPRIATALRAIGMVATMVFGVWFAIAAVKEANYSLSSHESIGGEITFPAWPARVCVIIGVVLLVLETLVKLTKLLSGVVEETPPVISVADSPMLAGGAEN